MGSDDSRFNVSLTVAETKSQDSVHKPQPHKTEKEKPKRNRAEALLVAFGLTARPDQTGCNKSTPAETIRLIGDGLAVAYRVLMMTPPLC